MGYFASSLEVDLSKGRSRQLKVGVHALVNNSPVLFEDIFLIGLVTSNKQDNSIVGHQCESGKD